MRSTDAAPRQRTPSQGLRYSVFYLIIIVMLFTGLLVGAVLRRYGVAFAILLVGCALAIGFLSRSDRKRSLILAQMPQVLDPQEVHKLPVEHATPRPSHDIRAIITRTNAARFLAPIPDDALRPGGQRADTLITAPGRIAAGCTIVAALCVAATICVGIILHTATAFLILLSIWLIALACNTSFAVTSCSPAAIYHRTRPGNGVTVRFRDIDTITVIFRNRYVTRTVLPRPAGLILQIGDRRVILPRQPFIISTWQPILARLAHCNATRSLDTYSALDQTLQKFAATDHDTTP